MKLSRVVQLICAASLAVAGRAGAQNVVLTAPYAPGGGAVTAFGYYMSPYSGTLDGVTERFNCVDFFHDVFIGEHWLATNTNLGEASRNLSLLMATRGGSYGGAASLSFALKLYEEAAWLTDQYGANPAADPNRAVAIQTAIWSIVDNGPTNAPGLQYASTHDYWSNGAPTSLIVDTGTGSTGYWINRAESEYAFQSDTYYDKFHILTGYGDPGFGAQEFIYANPEPGTLVLIASGLFGMAGVQITRRRRAKARIDG